MAEKKNQLSGELNDSENSLTQSELEAYNRAFQLSHSIPLENSGVHGHDISSSQQKQSKIASSSPNASSPVSFPPNTAALGYKGRPLSAYPISMQSRTLIGTPNRLESKNHLSKPRRMTIPDLRSDCNIGKLASILKENLGCLLVHRSDDNGFLRLRACNVRDWFIEGNSRHKYTNNEYWDILNIKLGNLDGSMESLLEMLRTVVGLSAEQINRLDVKNVEMCNAVIARKNVDENYWNIFSTDLEDDCRLTNDAKIVSKMRYICNEEKFRTIYMLTSDRGIDFIGGKMLLGEYMLYPTQPEILYASLIRETLEELRLSNVEKDHIVAPTLSISNQLIPFTIQCKKNAQPSYQFSLTFIQICPFLVKIEVNHILE